MSITAFPVLARILTESKLILSTAGVMTMGAAGKHMMMMMMMMMMIFIMYTRLHKTGAYKHGCDE